MFRLAYLIKNGAVGNQRNWPVAALLVICMLAMTIGAFGCAGTTGGGGANQPPLTRLGGQHPTNADLSYDHAAPSGRVIQMELHFAMRNQRQFDQLMNEISDPKSPEYQHWLTPADMHAQFGETQKQFDAVEQWLRARGFTIIDKAYGSNSDYIRFKGTIAQAERAFKIQIVAPEYDLYANKEDPAVPDQFAGVISYISGLDDIGGL
ncbi:MAG: protease pro-enzyme activation domain-containing protein [Candidatus Binataceae bacterium]